MDDVNYCTEHEECDMEPCSKTETVAYEGWAGEPTPPGGYINEGPARGREVD